MSIVNAFIRPDVAIVGVDTDGLLPDGTMVSGLKMILLPHMSAAIAFRGMDLTFHCSTVPIYAFHGDFDGLAEQMETIVQQSVMLASQNAHQCGRTPDDAALANFVLVGYSAKAGRMVGHVFMSAPGDQGVQISRDVPQAISPFWGQEDIARLKIVADKDGMKALALDQCRLVRERGPKDFPAGGRFLIAEIRKGSISVEDAGSLL